MSTDQISAPFSADQVDYLNYSQVGVRSVSPMHPFTCPNRSDGIKYLAGMENDSAATHSNAGGDRGVLIATASGFVCPHCSYTQGWAHAFLAVAPPAVASKPGRFDPAAIMMQKLDSAEAAYTKLRALHVLGDGEVRNADTRALWSAIDVMLASLARRRIELVEQSQTAPVGQALAVANGV